MQQELMAKKGLFAIDNLLRKDLQFFYMFIMMLTGEFAASFQLWSQLWVYCSNIIGLLKWGERLRGQRQRYDPKFCSGMAATHSTHSRSE